MCPLKNSTGRKAQGQIVMPRDKQEGFFLNNCTNCLDKLVHCVGASRFFLKFGFLQQIFSNDYHLVVFFEGYILLLLAEFFL